jgi:hypothetical protein
MELNQDFPIIIQDFPIIICYLKIIFEKNSFII